MFRPLSRNLFIFDMNDDQQQRAEVHSSQTCS
jgi:hypothetical protein